MTARATIGLAVGLALTLGARPASAQQAADGAGIPVVTLAEALDLATALDPDYVVALRGIGEANWRRWAAYSAYVLPEVQFTSSATRFSSDIFNVGTGRETDRIVDATLSARYELFRGGGKFFDLKKARADLEGARASEVQARFESALETESDYYSVLAQRELARVAEERVRRAEEQLAVARARVLSGAAVQSDSLQLNLELVRAQVGLLEQQTRLRVARYQLGRRIGHDGPVDAAGLETEPAGVLPLSLDEAIAEARERSPGVVEARALARAAEAGANAQWSEYLPRLDLFAQYTGFDEEFFPTATTRNLFGVQLTIPIWDNVERETRLKEARSLRAIALARRDDTERGTGRDVVEGYEGYETARAATELAETAVVVARENLRVQDERYRAGATTIIDLVTAQVDLADAEAGLVQARHSSRLALAGLEAILGRRLLPKPSP